MLVAAWKNVNDELNKNGATLLLTLARYFRSKLPAPPFSRR